MTICKPPSKTKGFLTKENIMRTFNELTSSIKKYIILLKEHDPDYQIRALRAAKLTIIEHPDECGRAAFIAALTMIDDRIKEIYAAELDKKAEFWS